VDVDEVEFLRRLYAQFNARETESLLAQMTPDVMWANAMEGGYAQGREAVLAYWTRQWSMFDPHVEPEEFSLGENGTVAVKVHQVVKDFEGKVIADVRVGHVFRMEGGLVKRFDVSEDWSH
jgi:ketosteroid isomerase-like protein